MGNGSRPPLRLRLQQAFPELSPADYIETSEFDPRYNCIAHAAGDVNAWWQPGYYWPSNAIPDMSIDALRSVFEALGYSVRASGELEVGFEKVALYIDSDRHWSHAAKQMANGRWSSKIGAWEDIEHRSPHCFGGPDGYGEVAYFMKRRLAD